MSRATFDIISKYNDKGVDQAEKSLKSLSQTAEKEGKSGGTNYAKGFSRNAEQSVDKTEAALKKLAGRAATEGKDGGRKYGSGFSQQAEKGVDDAWKAVKELTGKADSEGEDAGARYGVGFSKGLGGMGGRVSGFFSTSLGKAAGLGSGLLAGGGFVAAFQEAMDQGDLNAKLQVQLGLTDKQAAKAGRISGDLYSNNFGESVGAVNDTIRKIVQDTEVGINSISLKSLTAKIVTVTETFEQEAGQVTRSAGQLVRTGLARSTGQAIDIITKGFQEGADKSEDFLDTLNEYGTLFRNMGLSGAKATGILVQGLEAGARDADKVADAIKEFSIRAVDGSDLTRQAFKKLGFDAEDITTKIGKGGRTAFLGLNSTLMALRDIEDPVKRTRLAVALFGTQAEDLGEALFAIDPSQATRRLGKFAGAAKGAVDTVGSTPQAKVQTFVRTLKQDLVEGLAAAIEAFETGRARGKGFVGFMADAGATLRTVADAVKRAAEVFQGLPGPIQKAALAVGAFLLLRNKFAGFGSAISTHVIAPFRDAPSAIGGFKGALVSTGKMMLRGGLWGIAIGTAGMLLGTLFSKFVEGKQFAHELRVALEADAGAIGKLTQEAIAYKLANSGMIGIAKRARVSFEMATKAALGESSAITFLNTRLAFLDRDISRLSKTRMSELTPAQKKNLTNMVAERDALQKLIGKTGDLNGTLKKQRDEYRKQEKIRQIVKGAIDGESDALSRNTKKGEENRKKLGSLAKGAMDTARQMINLGKDQGSVTRRMEEARKKFIEVAKSMGVPDERAQKLAQNLIDLKPKLKGAGDNFKTFRDRVNNFLGGIRDRQVNITTRAQIPAGVSVRQLMEQGIPKADGGMIYGPGGPRDDKIHARLSNGEFVVNAAATKRHRQVLEAINSGRGFANGGLVSVRAKSEGLGEFGAFTRQFNSGVGWMSQLIGKGLLEVLKKAGGPALQWAKSQAGKPYVWGGVGPGGYDCSGFMSAIVNVIRGRSPHSRLGSTATFPWGGFRPGTGNFMIGSTPNAGNGIGHMAGTLNGVNVESRGGDGVVVGGSARGATSSLFNGPWALQGYAHGGLVKGDPPFDLMSPRGKHFQKMFAIFDKGGVLKAGQAGVNKSGKPERILSPRQTNAFERLVDALTGGMKQSDAPLAKQLKNLHKTITGIAKLLRKADRDAMARRLGDPFRKRIANLLKRRERLDERLEKAREKRDRIVSRRREVSGGLRGGILEGRNLVGGFGIDIDGSFSAGDIAKQLKVNLGNAKRFQGLLRKMRKMGFSTGIIAQVAQAGPAEGMATAEALTQAQSGQVGDINKSFGGIGKAAGAFSKEIGKKLYGASQRAAQGLVDGLREKRDKVQRIMTRLGRMMARILRRALRRIESFPERMAKKAEQMEKRTGSLDGRSSTARQRAAKQILRHLREGGSISEDFSFRGDSALVGRFNDRFARRFDRSGREFNRGNLRQFLKGEVRRGDVHIHIHGSRDSDDLIRRLRHELKTNRTLRRELGLAK